MSQVVHQPTLPLNPQSTASGCKGHCGEKDFETVHLGTESEGHD